MMTEYISTVHSLILNKMQNNCESLESNKTLQNVLQEYEVHIKTIEKQLDLCKKDHADLRAEIKCLVEENKSLYLRLMSKSDTGNNEQLDVVSNLSQQLALALEERQTLEGLWKLSLGEVESLKEKLRQYSSGEELVRTKSKLSNIEKDYSEAINLLESKLTSLSTENEQLNTKTDFLEEQLKHHYNELSNLTEKNASLNHSLNTATQNEQECKLKYLMLEAKYIELDKSYQADKVKFAHVYEYEKVESSLKDKLEGALRQRDELQSALEKCHETKAELLRAAGRDRAKVEEAVQLVDGAIVAQNQALQREAKSAEEAQRIKEELNRLIEEAGLRVGQEVSAAKKQFHDQLADVKHLLSIVEQERNLKTVEADQLQRACARLESQLLQRPNGTEEEVKNKQVERLNKELRLAECECLEFKIENEKLQDAIARLQEKCRKRNKEKSELTRKLQDLDQHNEHCQRELAASAERAHLLTAELHETSMQLALLHRDLISHKENVIGSRNRTESLTKVTEIYKKLDSSYSQMNGKWKNEMNELTQKFEAKLKKYKRKNKELENSVKKSAALVGHNL